MSTVQPSLQVNGPALKQLRHEHVGSLNRPPELKETIRRYQAGALSLEQLRGAEDSAIRRALQAQEEAGVGIYTDGEYRRQVFSDTSVKLLTAGAWPMRNIRWSGEDQVRSLLATSRGPGFSQ